MPEPTRSSACWTGALLLGAGLAFAATARADLDVTVPVGPPMQWSGDLP